MSKGIKFKDNTYLDSSGITHNRTPLKDILNNGVLRSKIISATRDGQGANGNVSYIGVGFRPTSMRCLSNIDGTLYQSDGFTDSAGASQCIYQAAANVNYNGNGIVAMYSNYSAWYQMGTLVSFDADGFTLNWSKVGTPPAGTMQLRFICYK